jgi:cysteine desulfurase
MIYLDNHATTACDPAVLAAMMPFFTDSYANPSSSHWFGQDAAAAVERAQEQVASLIGGEAAEVVFTSGATESNNLAILGTALQHKHVGGNRRQIATTIIEHKSVIGPCEHLAHMGWEIVYLPVDETGSVILESAVELITEKTLLVSVQAANSEIGTIQPVRQLANYAHSKGALMHCDASQAIGKIPINVNELGVDLLSISAHKMYGPKGIGALWLHGGVQTLPLYPLMAGGRNSSGLRPGTLPVPLIVGFGVACQQACDQLDKEERHLAKLRDSFEKILIATLPGLIINGALDNRLPNNSSITFSGLDAEALLANLDEVVASTGSACEAGSIEPSRVLTALGLTREAAFSTLRFGLGRFTTDKDVMQATSQIIKVHQYLSLLLA